MHSSIPTKNDDQYADDSINCEANVGALVLEGYKIDNDIDKLVAELTAIRATLPEARTLT